MHGIPSVIWKGSFILPLISIILYVKQQKIHVKGFNFYLAYVCDIRADSPSLYSIPIIHDFLDVFPGTSLELDFKFAIDLELGTTPISIASYVWILLSFNSQLQDLFSKGLIRPCVSPWGVLSLFVKNNEGSM